MLSRAAQGKRERLEDALPRCRGFLERLGRQGLSRSSPRTTVDLSALAQTAHNAGLVKLERMLESLGTSVERYLERSPQFRESTYLRRLNHAWLLLEVAEGVWKEGVDPSTRPALIGQYRRSYVEREQPLHLQALGASGWVTDSGFVGVTVQYTDGYQLTTARPVDPFGSDPRTLMRYPLSERYDGTIGSLAHGAFTFHQARVAWDKRISASGNLAVRPAPWSGAAYDTRMASCGQAVSILGPAIDPLAGAPSAPVLLEGFRISGLVDDEVGNRVVLTLRDPADQPLRCPIEISPQNDQLIDNLSMLVRSPNLQPPAWYGRLWADGGLHFQPMSAVFGEPRMLRERRGTREVNEVHLGLEDLEALR